MNLNKDEKKALNAFYGNLSEELHIFYRSLRNEGFDSNESMRILIAFINQPGKIQEIKSNRQIVDGHHRMLERLRNSRVQVQSDKEKENG